MGFFCDLPYDQVQFTAQKMNFSIKDFFSKYDQIHSFLQIWSYLLEKSLMENFNFCAVINSIDNFGVRVNVFDLGCKLYFKPGFSGEIAAKVVFDFQILQGLDCLTTITFCFPRL